MFFAAAASIHPSSTRRLYSFLNRKRLLLAGCVLAIARAGSARARARGRRPEDKTHIGPEGETTETAETAGCGRVRQGATGIGIVEGKRRQGLGWREETCLSVPKFCALGQSYRHMSAACTNDPLAKKRRRQALMNRPTPFTSPAQAYRKPSLAQG